jgi:nucleotide-binding universal stress UspA family protein
MPSPPRVRGMSLRVMSRLPDLWSRSRCTRREPAGPQTASAGAAPTLPQLPPDGALLAEEAASFLLEQLLGKRHDDPRSRSAYRLLLPYTDSEPAQRALEAVVELSSRVTIEVRVLHVREWDDFGRGGRFFFETREEALAIARDAVGRLLRHGLGASGVVETSRRRGVPSEILAKADQLGADAIVVGSRQRPLITAALLGSVSHRLMRRANRPLILVPTPPR